MTPQRKKEIKTAVPKEVPHILVVEDEEAHAELIRRAFAAAAQSFDVRVVENLKEARAAVAAAPPDVLVTDINLTDGRGTALIAAAQGESRFPVVVLTAHGDEKTAVAAMKAGAADYIPKSQEAFADLPRVAERVLGQWRDRQERRRAEAALRDSEARFERLAAAANEGIVISEAGKILDANDQYARIFGYKRAEVVGMNVLDLVAPEDRELVKTRLAEMYEGRYEIKGLRRGGAVLTLEVRGKPIPYEGRTVRVTAVSDITERKRTEEELRASEQRYRRLFEAARDGILILDAESGDIVDVNPFLTEILGYTRKDLLGKKLWEIGVFADERACRAAFAELQSNKYIRYEDLPLETKDGRASEVEFVSNVYQVGGREVIQCNIRDITARKDAEKALLEAETRLRAVVTNTPIILYAVDRDGTITLFEGKGAYAAGYKPGELVGLNIFEDFADQPYLLECVRRALAGKEHDCTIPGRKGRLFDTRFTPVRDEKNRVAGATAVGVDITAAVEAEKAVRASEAELAAIFRGTPVIMALVDRERRVRKLNRDGVAFAGRAETDLLGLRGGEVLRCLHALDDPQGCGFGRACATCAIRTATLESLDTGKEVRQRRTTFEVDRGGAPEEIALLVSATPLDLADDKAVLLTLEDVTDLERAEEALRVSEERYALAQRAADIGSWDWDVTTGDLHWSEAIEPMFGFAPGQFGATYEAFLASVHADDRDFVVSSVDAAVHGKQDYDIEHRVVWPDGTVRWVAEKGDVFYDAEDKPVRMLGVVRDITARKEAQEGLKRALAETEQRRAEMAALLHAAGAVLEVPHFEAAAQAIFKSAKEAIGAAAGYVALLTPDGSENEVIFLDAGELRCDVDPKLPMPIRGFREVAIRTQKPIYENDFGHTPWVQFMPPGHAPLHNVLFAPLIIETKTVGLLGLGNKPGGFTPNDALLAGAFADFAAVALQNYRNLDKLEASEERYRRIVETAEEGIWVLDENNDTVFVNQKMAGMLGYGVRELTGKPFLKYVDAGAPGMDAADELRRRGVVEQRDVKLRRRDGAELWGISVMSPIFDEGGRYAGALTMITDITERKRAEEALREAEMRYRSLFEQSPDGIVILDPQTMKPLEFNETASRQLGYTPEEFARLAVFDYEALETGEETRAHVEKLLRVGRDDFETRHRTKSGEILDVFVTTQLVEIDGRKVLYTIFRDLTPLKRAEEKLLETAAELARSNKDLEQFAYVASHDLKEPLRMVTSYLQLLEKRYGDRLDGDAVEFLNFAVDGARRMGEMVQDLLDYSRVGSRGKPFEPTDLNAVVERTLSDLQVAIEENGALITRDELPTVAADASQMRQLFQNLLGNAVKFRGAEPPQIHVGTERRDGQWLVSVRDNGIGISPEYRERIFGVFQRLHDRGEYPGTGIGLAICEKIVARHGGRIWVESEPGRGATFYFTLPDRGDER